MNRNKLIAVYVIGLGVAGCSETAIAALLFKGLHLPPAVTFAADGPCDVSSVDHMKYGPAHLLIRVPMQMPKAALAAHADGDAGAEFQLDPTGSPRNIKIVCETPPGYGLGQALVNSLKQQKYKPNPYQGVASPDQWYYDSASLRFDKPVGKH